jgi:hypothetical protein
MFTRHRLLLRRSPYLCCFGCIPPLPFLFLYLLGICAAYGGSRGADRKPMPYPDTSTPPEQGLFWAPWRGLSSASRPCLGLLWDGGNSGPTRMYFASCGFELCLNLELEPGEGLVVLQVKSSSTLARGSKNRTRAVCSGTWCSHWQSKGIT